MKERYVKPFLQKFANAIVDDFEKTKDNRVAEFLYSFGQYFNMWCVFYDIYLE